MPSHKDGIICLVGGTGFVGRHLIGELAQRGYRIRVLTRQGKRHRKLLAYPQLELLEVNVHDADALQSALAGVDAVINLSGILNASRGAHRSFSAVHVGLVENVVAACRGQGVRRLLHMSALRAGPDAPSIYLRTKAQGEAVAFAAADAMAVSVFRPSVIFGPNDSFFNRFAQLLTFIPGFFPLACPGSRFAPVFIGDVVRAFVDSIDDERTFGQAYDLCGPHQYSLYELVEYTAAVQGLKRKIIGLGPVLSQLQARILEWVPGKPFSMDNYRSLELDSVCGCNGLEALNISPTSLESVVPGYLGAKEPEFNG